MLVGYMCMEPIIYLMYTLTIILFVWSGWIFWSCITPGWNLVPSVFVLWRFQDFSRKVQELSTAFKIVTNLVKGLMLKAAGVWIHSSFRTWALNFYSILSEIGTLKGSYMPLRLNLKHHFSSQILCTSFVCFIRG